MIANPTLKMIKVRSALSKSLAYDLKTTAGKGEIIDDISQKQMRDFRLYMDGLALQSSMFSHLYELGHRGSPTHRLFRIASKKGRGLTIYLIPAKMVTPLSDAQTTAGPTGKIVKKRYRFPARPFVYEYGQTIKIYRKPNTQVMWTFHTWPVPPKRGPIIIHTNTMPNKFALRGASQLYFKTRGRIVMNAEAAKHAARIGRKARAAAMKAGV